MIIIKDTEGKYEINVDPTRMIAFQKHEGMFKEDCLERLDQDYKTKVIPLFKGSKWAKCCDLRNYKVGGDITDKMNIHNTYCIEKGMSHVALIVESAIVKMQMNRAGKQIQFAPTACLDEKEADIFLKSNGY